MRYTITKATIRRILPIALTFTLIIAYIAFFYYSNLASTVFASHLSGDLVRQMHIDYDSGFVISGRNERNGLVVGTLSDTQTRQRLLQNQPFTNCVERCDTWKPVEHTTFIPILENNNLPDELGTLLAQYPLNQVHDALVDIQKVLISLKKQEKIHLITYTGAGRHFVYRQIAEIVYILNRS